MLQEFLKRLGSVTGKTYTPAEFQQILKEAADYKPEKKEEPKKDKPKK